MRLVGMVPLVAEDGEEAGQLAGATSYLVPAATNFQLE